MPVLHGGGAEDVNNKGEADMCDEVFQHVHNSKVPKGGRC